MNVNRRSRSLDTLKYQNQNIELQLKHQNSRNQLQYQETIQQKLHRIGTIQNSNQITANNVNQTNSSKKPIAIDSQEIKLFVQQQNQNYNKLMGEKLDLEEEVKYLRGVNEKLTKTQQALTVSKLNHINDTDNSEQGTYVKQIDQIEIQKYTMSKNKILFLKKERIQCNQSRQLENELYHLQQQMRIYKQNLTSDNSSNKKFLSNADYDPHNFSNKISDLGKIISDQKSEIQQLQMKIKEKEKSIEYLKENMNIVQTQINEMEQEKGIFEKSCQNEVQRVKDSQAMELESLRIKAQIALSDSEQSKHSLIISNNKQINDLQDELREVNRSKAKVTQDLQSTITQLKAAHDKATLQFTTKTKDLENSLFQLEKKYYKQKSAHELEIEQLKQLQDERIEMMKKEVQSKENQQLKKNECFQSALREAEKDKNTKAEIIKQMKLELEDVKTQLKLTKDQSEIQIDNLKQEIKRFGQSKNEIIGRLTEKEKQNKQLLIEIEDFKQEIKSLEQNVQQARVQIEEQVQNQNEESNIIVEEKIAEYQIELQKKIKEIDDERMLELKAQRDKFIGEIIQLEIRHKHELERLTDQLNGHEHKDSQENKSADAKIKDVKQQYEEKLKSINQQQDKQMKQLKEESENMIEQLKKDQDQMKEKLKQDYESVIQAQKLDFELNIKLPLERELSELQKKSHEIISSLEAQIQMLKQDMDGLKTYQKSFIEKNKQVYEAKLAQEKKIIQQLQNQIEQQIKEIELSQKNIEEQQDQIKQLNSLINIIKCEKAEQCILLEDEINKIHQSYTSKENKVIDKYEEELLNAYSDNMNFVLKMRSEFDELLQIENEKYFKVLQEYEELLRLYDAKGCREIDAIYISNLKDECERTQQELKYLILEVVNREKMYNKIFTNYQETEFMQMLLKKAEILDQQKQMINNVNNDFIQLESNVLDQSNLTESLNFMNSNLTTKNNFLPSVNTTKSIKGLKTEETQATSNNYSGSLKFTPKIVSRGLESNASSTKYNKLTETPQRGFQSKRPATQGIPSVQSQIVNSSLNQSSDLNLEDNMIRSKTNYNSLNKSSTAQQGVKLSTNIDQFNYSDSNQQSIKQNFSQKQQTVQVRPFKANSTTLTESGDIDSSNVRRKYVVRERRCLSQMTESQQNSSSKQNEHSFPVNDLASDSINLVLNSQSVNLQNQQYNQQKLNVLQNSSAIQKYLPNTPQNQPITIQKQGNNTAQRRKYSKNKEVIKNKSGMYNQGSDNQLNQQKQFSELNIENNNNQRIHGFEQQPQYKNKSESDIKDNYSQLIPNQKSVDIKQHYDSQLQNNNMQGHTTHSQPSESSKPSYAQIYAQIFMNQVSRVIKTSEGNGNNRKKFI